MLLLLATADRVPATILAKARMCVLQARAVVRRVELVRGQNVAWEEGRAGRRCSGARVSRFSRGLLAGQQSEMVPPANHDSPALGHDASRREDSSLSLLWTLAMLVSSLLSLLALPVLALADQSFLNTALVRTIDLGGATSLVTTTYTAKSLSSSPEGVYEVLVGRKEWESRGWFEVREKRAKSAAAGKEDGGLRWTAGEYDISSYVLPVFSPYCEPLRSPKPTLL